MEISLAESVSAELEAIWFRAVTALEHHRGGSAFYAGLWADAPVDSVLHEVVDAAELFIAKNVDEIVGIIVFREQVIEGLFVDPTHRRKGVARLLVSHLMNLNAPPRDAHVLPGDRGMKSLFESFGWKARLLTMRGE